MYGVNGMSGVNGMGSIYGYPSPTFPTSGAYNGFNGQGSITAPGYSANGYTGQQGALQGNQELVPVQTVDQSTSQAANQAPHCPWKSKSKAPTAFLSLPRRKKRRLQCYIQTKIQVPMYICSDSLPIPP